MKNKFLKFITSLPVLISASIVVPVSLSMLSYLLSPNNRYNNETYDGHILLGSPYDFKLERIDRLFKIANHSTWSNYQGGAFYNQFYCLAANNAENLLIYDMTNYHLDEVITNFDLNNSYHCNTISFGNTFYSKKDKFPLLYVSMENSDVHCTNVYRLHRKSLAYYAELVQTIIFPTSSECGIYLPNSYIDQYNILEDNEDLAGFPVLYYSGYTKNSYMKEDDNYLRFFTFKLPTPPEEGENYDYVVNLKDQVLEQINKKQYHDVPSQTATQGGFVCQGCLYQTFAFHDNPIMRILDLSDFTIVYEESIGKYGWYDEYENIGTYNNRIFAFGIKNLSIFEFKFNAGE